ncbi:MAG: hypothetical protein AAFY26_05305, partial [Cyanobacteria bacterium J06638_22]
PLHCSGRKQSLGSSTGFDITQDDASLEVLPLLKASSWLSLRRSLHKILRLKTQPNTCYQRKQTVDI